MVGSLTYQANRYTWRGWHTSDPATSALTPRHELRGSPGLFVTDGSSVPCSLTVNPSLTIAALAERASLAIGKRATELGVPLGPPAPPPGRS